MGVRIRPGEGAGVRPSLGWVGKAVGMGVGQDRGAWLGGAHGLAGLEKRPTAPVGQGVMAAGAGMGPWAGWGSPRAGRALKPLSAFKHLHLQTDNLISASATRNVT